MWAEFFLADKQTDMTKLIVVFLNFLNVSKNISLELENTQLYWLLLGCQVCFYPKLLWDPWNMVLSYRACRPRVLLIFAPIFSDLFPLYILFCPWVSPTDGRSLYYLTPTAEDNASTKLFCLSNANFWRGYRLIFTKQLQPNLHLNSKTVCMTRKL